MKLKKLLSFAAAAVMAITSLTGAMTFTASADDFDYTTIFDFTYSAGYAAYEAKLKSNYVDLLTAGNTTEVVYPETYDDGTNGAAPVRFSAPISNDSYVTSIKLNSSTNSTSTGMFKRFTSLTNVEFTYTGSDLTLGANAFRDSVLTNLYIYASAVTVADSAFRSINETVKIYVANEDVKQTIVDSTASGSYPVSADQIEVMKDFDYTTIFNFSYSNGYAAYEAKLKSNYVDLLTAGNTTEVVYPETYDDGTNGAAPVRFSAPDEDDSYITSISLNSSVNQTTSGMLGRFQALKTVVFPYTGADFTLGATMAWNRFYSTTSIEEIYIYASSVTLSATTTFRGINSTVKIYVVNEDVKQAIVDGTASGSYPVSADQIFLFTPETGVNKFEALDEALTNAKTYTESNLYTSSSRKALEDAVAAARIVRYTETSTEEEIANAVASINTAIEGLIIRADSDARAALTEALNNAKNYNNDEGLYTDESYKALTDAVAAANALDTLDITQSEAEAATAAINNAINGLTLKPTDWSAFDALIAEAEDIVNNHHDEYWEVPMQSFERQLATFKEFRQNESATQTEINEQAKTLSNVILGMANSKIDKAAMIETLNQAIAEAEKLDPTDYTEDSWAVLAEKLEAAKAITEESSPSDIRSATNAINDPITGAINKLVFAKLDAIVEVPKGGKEVKITEITADESIAGAAQIRFTFDCAEDVSFNPYATIDFKAVVAGTQNFNQFTGNNNTTGATNKVVLPLSSAINNGDSVVLSSSTWSWADAKDYVYAVTKIEFLDENGNVLDKVTAKTIAQEDLSEAIANAEAIDTTPYTEESVKALTDIIETAKELLTDEPTVAEINEAITAIENAVKALKLAVVTGTVTGTINVSDKDNSTEMTVTAVAADGTEVSVTASSMGTYELENLAVGDYTLTISGGKYAPRSYEITVEEGSIAQDVNLNPYGDINGDGKVTTADVGLANSHAKGVKTLTDYDFVCGDVNRDGGITTADVGMINSHAKGVKALW